MKTTDIVKGYKALKKDMSAIYGEERFELGKWYHTTVKLCSSSEYKFSDNIRDIFSDLGISEYDIYEIEANGAIYRHYNTAYHGTYAASDIKFIRKLTEEDIDKYIKDNLDMLVEDKYSYTRTVLAKRGYCLDKLVDDPYYTVRICVAEHGFGLDKLIHDYDVSVRGMARMVAKKKGKM